jgi:putative ABC transport system permease protein
MLSSVRAALARFRELFRSRSQHDLEQDEEFRFHLEMETAENVRRGMSESDARRAAFLKFGGTQRFREETSDARGIVVVDNLARDTRFALRRIRRAPAFAAGVIATLGIGIGAAVGIGTIVYGVLLRDLPYENPDQLVRIGFLTPGNATQGDLHSSATYFHFAKSARSFSELGAYVTNEDSYNITDGDSPERVTIVSMMPSTLTLLGVRPILGQLLEPGDSSFSNPRSAILISENLWRRRYGADPAILGRRIEINRGSRTVVGVLPSSFEFPTRGVDIYYPMPLPVKRPEIMYRGLNAIGRLQDGVPLSAAESELNALVPALTERFPTITPAMLESSQARVSVQSLKAAIVAPVRAQVVLLGVLVGVVLLIATTNVVNLFLLRTERASQELAIALSLGATRVALAQRFVMEGVVLGLASAVVALPAAAVALSTKFGFSEREIPRLHEVTFTPGVVGLVFVCAALIGGIVGLTAMTRTGMTGIFDRLRVTRATSSRAWRRAQNGLVAFQVAIALTLLVAAGLLGRSFWNLRNANIGFEPANAMTFHVSLPWSGYTTYEANAAFHARLMDRLTTLPGVASVAGARTIPLSSRRAAGDRTLLQAGDDAGRPVIDAASNQSSGDYFRVMGIPLRAGRSFEPGDLRGTPALIVSERLAQQIFGTTDVVGRTIIKSMTGYPSQTFRIVGVVGDVHRDRIEEGHVPMAYYPLLRDGDGLPADSSPVLTPREVQYVIRGTQLPTATTIRSIVKELDTRVPPTNIASLGSLLDDATARVRLTMLLIAVAGAAALLLGVVGVYSVVSYAASGRVREFGIRLALGAAPKRVGSMVLGDGLKLVAIGTFVGLLSALSATRFLRALLYEVEPTSVAEFALATTLLVVVTLLATLLPARRAARTHPAVVLRGE